MSEALTYEKVLTLITESSKRFSEKLEKSHEEYENRLKKRSRD